MGERKDRRGGRLRLEERQRDRWTVSVCLFNVIMDLNFCATFTLQILPIIFLNQKALWTWSMKICHNVRFIFREQG